MKLKYIGLVLLAGLWTTLASAQTKGTYYSVKGGLTIGTQQWNSFEREPLFAYHGIVAAESIPEQGRFSLFAQLGYHVKGSTIRRTLFGSPFNSSFNQLTAQAFKFYNIGLTLGAKQRLNDDPSGGFYYLFGIRGDYTVDTNLDEYDTFVNATNNSGTFFITPGTFPLDVYYNGQTLLGVRRINYGLTVGGGYDLPLSDYVGALIEFTVNPDFSLQYQQPAIDNVRNPFNPNQSRSISERRIRNLTFELTVGLRFLRRVEYID